MKEEKEKFYKKLISADGDDDVNEALNEGIFIDISESIPPIYFIKNGKYYQIH